MSDIRLHDSFWSHPKKLKLERRTGSEGVVSLLRLWSWAGENRADGKLTGLSDEDLEIAAQWHGAPGVFIAALIELRFVDSTSEGLEIHGWLEHQPWVAHMPERRAKARNAAAARWQKRLKDAPSMENDAPSIDFDAASTSEQCPSPAPVPSPNPFPSPAPVPSQKDKQPGAIAPPAAKKPKKNNGNNTAECVPKVSGDALTVAKFRANDDHADAMREAKIPDADVRRLIKFMNDNHPNADEIWLKRLFAHILTAKNDPNVSDHVGYAIRCIQNNSPAAEEALRTAKMYVDRIRGRKPAA